MEGLNHMLDNDNIYDDNANDDDFDSSDDNDELFEAIDHDKTLRETLESSADEASIEIEFQSKETSADSNDDANEGNSTEEDSDSENKKLNTNESYISKDKLQKLVECSEIIAPIATNGSVIIEKGVTYFMMSGSSASCRLDTKSTELNFDFSSIGKVALLKYFTNQDYVECRLNPQTKQYTYTDKKFKLDFRQSNPKINETAIKTFVDYADAVSNPSKASAAPLITTIDFSTIGFELQKLIELVKNTKESYINIESSADNKRLIFSMGELSTGYLTFIDDLKYNSKAVKGKRIYSFIDKSLFTLNYKTLVIKMYYANLRSKNENILFEFTGTLQNGFEVLIYARTFLDKNSQGLMF